MTDHSNSEELHPFTRAALAAIDKTSHKVMIPAPPESERDPLEIDLNRAVSRRDDVADSLSEAIDTAKEGL